MRQRLYIGGLSHTITQKDIKDRFGKFGEVADVELRTRKDDTGVPYKTFGYVNIDISEADLKKCLTVLNKSKWKGGTLQIETAKESFLQRLAQEQQAANSAPQQLEAKNKVQNLMESFSKAGIENFHMKAAVPGTEIPGHKDWVVGKFGRVLPILQMKCKKGEKAQILKHDPSKYSHNIHKLDRDAAEHYTPVSQLTWEVEGGNDDISKKRRGEFPPYEPKRPKKSPTDGLNICNPPLATNGEEKHVYWNLSSNQHKGTQHLSNSVELQKRKAQKISTRHDESEEDSEEEIRHLMAAQKSSHVSLQQKRDSSPLEVVGYDYLVNSRQKGDEKDYDSADTDELFTSKRKAFPHSEEKSLLRTDGETSNNMSKKSQIEKNQSKMEEKKLNPSHKTTLIQKENSNVKQSEKKGAQPATASPSASCSDEGELETANSSSDSEYEAMFTNVTHLGISLADLQKLASGAEENSDLSDAPIPTPKLAGEHVPKKCITPEEILASILEEDSSDDEVVPKKKKRKDKPSTSLPAFKGTKLLQEANKCEDKQNEEDGGVKGVQKVKTVFEVSQTNFKTEDPVTSEGVEVGTDRAKASYTAGEGTSKQTSESEADSSSSSDEEEKKKNTRVTEKTNNSASEASTSSEDSSEDDDDNDNNEIMTKETPVAPAVPPPRQKLAAGEEEELQRKANQRRLAALMQRQKEADEHKKLIKGALANLEGSAPGRRKHIVFDSDGENDGSEEENKDLAAANVTTSSKDLMEDCQSENETTSGKAATNRKDPQKNKPSGPQLFDSSEDEEGSDKEEEDSRFHIKPQFEGPSGQKLMELQSRFGTDERFRMDERFLEEEEENEAETKSLTGKDECLQEEKEKNLTILQGILGNSKQSKSTKTVSKTAKFRDVSALHFDPSKEEHAAFETKVDVTKESKAARKKKREEAKKLPEVSSEIFYEVSGDLKAVFGSTKENPFEEEGKTNWDQTEEDEDNKIEADPTPSRALADLSTKAEDESVFKFSFFGDDNAESQMEKTADYVVKSIQAPKVSWQQDPRFHDSSSDEGQEEREEENEEQTNDFIKTTDDPPLGCDLFFFHLGDTRLKDGPALFCRTSQLEEQREEWEDRRTALRQEVQKKHKDARRKQTAILKD